MKSSFLTFLILFVSLSLSAQSVDFEVPESDVLRKKADFERYEKDILKCIDWFEATPQDADKKKRKAANSFFIAWLTGTEKVSVVINEKAVSFAKKQPELLVYFMAGWTKYALYNQDIDITERQGTYEGLLFALKYYEKGNGIERSKELDDLVAKMNNNELMAYVERLVK